MNDTVILLNAYYEALYEFLDSHKAVLIEKIENYLKDELKKLAAPYLGTEKHAAYLDAALAFLDERVETYNPLGIQYTFDRAPAEFAKQLELQLNFYDSSEEFENLKYAASKKAFPGMTDTDLRHLACELIAEHGAFPDNPIINAYKSAPTLNKLPDYIVAEAIEDTIKAQ
jgi:hypothetical protein